MITYDCPNCLETIETEDAMGLREEECPVCRHVNLVPKSRKQERDERRATRAREAAEGEWQRAAAEATLKEGDVNAGKDETEGGMLKKEREEGKDQEPTAEPTEGSVPGITEVPGVTSPFPTKNRMAAPFGRAERFAFAGCCLALAMVSLSSLFCWVRTDNEWRNVSGLKGDAKIASMITVVGLLFLGVAAAKRRYLRLALVLVTTRSRVYLTWRTSQRSAGLALESAQQAPAGVSGRSADFRAGPPDVK